MEVTVTMDELKLNFESDKPLCRCCLSTENRTLNARNFGQYFMDLAGINVHASDGLPPWICYECHHLLQKATFFKYKMLRAQTMLYEYITRCAPFPIDAQDPELAKYASPHLNTTQTLAFDGGKGKMGFFKVYRHEKQYLRSELECIPMPIPLDTVIRDQLAEAHDLQQLKEEDLHDFDDDVPLEEFRSTANQILNDILDNAEQIKTEPKDELTKRKKKKETKSKKRKKEYREEELEEVPRKKSIRKPLEIDPEKIKIIILNPEEQVKQREEESKASLKFPYQCNLCYKGFNFESKLQNHMTKHSPSRGPYECSLCHMYLPSAYSYSVHSHIHTRRFQCLQCGLRMIDRASIYHHYRSKHEGITTQITCHICGKISSNNKTHRGHMRNHHSGDRPRCDQCGKTFVNKDSLTEHLQIHEGVKNYECSVCGKRCRTRTQIKHHQLKHTDVKDYYCVECDVRFKTAHSLKQHLQKSIKHKDLDSLKFECIRCPKRFQTLESLSSHERVQHEGIKSHACDACGAWLASKTSLVRHTATVHAGRKPALKHVCDTCGKAFRAKSVLSNHIRTHTGEKPFDCKYCGRPFSQRTAMRTHVRRVHCNKMENISLHEEKPQIANDVWRPQELFYVTAGP